MFSIIKDSGRLHRALLGLLGLLVAGHYLLAIFLPRWEGGHGQQLRDVSLVVELEAGFADLGYTANVVTGPVPSSDPAFDGAGPARPGRRHALLVPRAYLASLPDDWSDMGDAARRKNLFIRVMLPLVLQENERILVDRARLLRNDPGDEEWRRALGARYRLPTAEVKALARRLDVIPPSLAIAQAAIESGWGTSRFVRQGNALFGEWTWSGKGIAPARREPGRSHMIKAFDSLGGSVASYMRNLNSHKAYAELWRLREQRRSQGMEPKGLPLTAALIDYSQKGQAYVTALAGIIRRNGLAALDGARLAPASVRLARTEPARED